MTLYSEQRKSLFNYYNASELVMSTEKYHYKDKTFVAENIAFLFAERGKYVIIQTHFF